MMEIPADSPDLNPIETRWAPVKDKLQKHYPELYLLKGSHSKVKKVIGKPLHIVGNFLTQRFSIL